MDITQGIVLIYNDLNGAHILQIGGFQQGTLITRKDMKTMWLKYNEISAHVKNGEKQPF